MANTKKKDKMVGPKTIIFRGVYIREILKDITKDGVKHYIAMTADWADTVAAEMGWDEKLPEYLSGAKALNGRLGAGELVLDPGTEWKKFKITFEHTGISDFKAHPIKDGEGDEAIHELRFTVSFDKSGILDKLDAYTNQLVRHAAQMQVQYVGVDEDPAAHQQPLVED